MLELFAKDPASRAKNELYHTYYFSKFFTFPDLVKPNIKDYVSHSLTYNNQVAAKGLANWEETANWCQDFGGPSRFCGTMMPMINACISGPASLRTHLLQNWQFPGALAVYLAC